MRIFSNYSNLFSYFFGGGYMDTFKGYMQRWGCMLACFVLALLWLVCPAEAEDHKMVRVGWFEDSYNITDASGQRRGYGYEFQQAVASYTGWEYQYVKADWSDLIKMMEHGDIDMMSGISYTEDRSTKMLFSDLPMGGGTVLSLCEFERNRNLSLPAGNAERKTDRHLRRQRSCQQIL